MKCREIITKGNEQAPKQEIEFLLDGLVVFMWWPSETNTKNEWRELFVPKLQLLFQRWQKVDPAWN